MIGSAAATAGLLVAPLFGEEAQKNAAATQQADPNAIPVALNVNGRVHELKRRRRTPAGDPGGIHPQRRIPVRLLHFGTDLFRGRVDPRRPREIG